MTTASRFFTQIGLPLCLMLTAWTHLQGQGIRYVIRQIGTEEGLLHTDAPSVIQDQQGFMWFATLSGLQRYDGFEFKEFINHTDPLNRAYHNRILQLALDRQGRIWMATYDEMTCFDPKVEAFHSVKLPDTHAFEKLRHLRTIHIDAQNRLFAATRTDTWAFQITESGSLTYLPGLPEGKPILNDAIGDIISDSHGNVWMSGNSDVWRWDPRTSTPQITHYDIPGADFSKPTPYLSQLEIDQEQGLIINGKQELYRIDLKKFYADGTPKTLPTTIISLSELEKHCPSLEAPMDWDISSFAVDKENHLWIGTTQGLVKMDLPPYPDPNFQCFQSTDIIPNSLSSNHVSSLYIDRSGVLWIGTWGGGVNLLNLEQKKFFLLKHDPENVENGFSGPFIRAVYEDDETGLLWVGTRERGLNVYHPETATFEHFEHTPGQPNTIMNNHIRSLTKGPKNRLWMGTDRGLGYLDLDSRTFHEIDSDEFNFWKLAFYSIVVDHTGDIWAGAWHGGLFRLHENESGEFEITQIHEVNGTRLTSDNITFLRVEPERGQIWVSTQGGLNQLLLSPQGALQELRTYQVHPNYPLSLSSNFIWPTIRENDSTIWVGTLGGGLNKMVIFDPNDQAGNSKKRETRGANYRAEYFDASRGAPFNDVETLLMDEDRNLWLGGRGLVKFNPAQDEFSLYDESDGLQGNSFKIGAAFRGKNGIMYFGGTRGLTYFHPKQIHTNFQQANTGLGKLMVNNREVLVGQLYEGNQLLTQELNQVQQLELSHNQNNFSLQFASLHYVNPEKCKFRYMLDGYDNHWIYVSAKDHHASYSNLEYGDYTFRLVASNSDGIWGHDEKTLKISVIPPWYATTWAKILYVLLALTILVMIYYYLSKWQSMKRNLELTQMEEKKKEEMHQLRLQFFTNISHEFRTPLSLILSPLQKIAEQDLSKIELQRHVKLIADNSNRLLRLVNELLDFRKLDEGQIQLRVTEGDLNSFVHAVAKRFEELAASKDIDYQIEVPEARTLACFDPEVVEKILYNLLSNSFKYTPVGGTVKLVASMTTPPPVAHYPNQHRIVSDTNSRQNLYLQVMDSGVGISQSSIEHLFDRYYRVSDSPADQHLGSGIGLALVKNLILLHKGDIEVRSEREKGSEFSVKLPLDIDLYEIHEWADHSQDELKFTEPAPLTVQEHAPIIQTKHAQGVLPRLLIVEDNHPVRQYLAESLGDEFEIIEAVQGKEGLEKAHSARPDIIVSDIMMPEMNGIELCAAIKADEQLAHIPVVLLTAKSSTQSQIEGLESGADLYFSKPFNLSLIRLNLKNLLQHRDRLRNRHITSALSDHHQQARSERDKELFDKIVDTIDNRMDDVDFDVESLCREVGMSRTNLYAKMREITGQPIGEFIRQRRLRKAAVILTEGNVTVLEVMDRVGIRSQSYFTRAFKKEFGKTPSQFVQEISKQRKPLSMGKTG
ncbi:two-component regulator propeller domain-containing protein [Pontibacter sp. G13]|uniref:hybrid sensor histidine kinase/response regulator transcription factor n=1 Tax=Pontibacter sp. G13 TaxID=3074898 RepID=UPI002889FC7A|nr:two-component regulator propeller domain-containing protein [Pontibacter sp. G13]WNJ19145.1 two-component regulator propeller domain-containing protein [Pontibacter sp. G13]